MNNRLLHLIFTLFFSITSFAQDLIPTDYLNASFHKERRTKFRAKMPKKSIALFFSNPVQNRSNDVDFIFHQDPNLYYLSGYKEPNGLLVIFSEKTKIGDQMTDEILFVQERNPQFEQWNGYRLGVEGAKYNLGFDHVFIGKELYNLPINYESFDKIMLNLPNGKYTNHRNDKADSYKLLEFINNKIAVQNNSSSKVDSHLLRKIITELRQIKTPEEINLLKKAAKISAIGQIEVMKAIHPNMSETEIQGIHEFVYKKYGSEYEGYPSIVGAGSNGCVLHYIENTKTKVGNDLVLMDLGAEYHGYTADVTRTIPANGKFNQEQKIIYQIVLDAQKAAIQKAVPGNTIADVDKAARDFINKELMKLGIIKNEKEGRKFFPHGTSHYLGLDVHDLGDYQQLKPNMVITVEPGIYIPNDCDCDNKWKGIAVRIEDDILITENSPINLSIDAPKEISEIEKMMKQSSVLKNYKLPQLD